MPTLLRIATILGLLLAAATTAHAERRVALIIGIGAYENLSPLANPVADARAVATALRGFGYDVSEHYDLARGDFLNALEDFERAADQADLALVYYAGHGMEVGGANVLAPIDTQVSCEPRQTRRAVEVGDLFDALGRAKNQVVLLDACRDDPFPQCASRGGRSGAGFRGLQRVIAQDTSLLIANATLSGQLAADGDAGEHSPFATALLSRFASDGGMPLRDMLDHTARDVRQATNGVQVPEITTQGGAPNICLTADCGAAPAPQVSAPAPQAVPLPAAKAEPDDKIAYEAAVEVGSCGALQAFVEAFPGSFYATLAKERAKSACAASQPLEQQAVVAPAPLPVERGHDPGFIFPDSHIRRLSPGELGGLSSSELRLARNEIYARKGRFFKSADLTAHFSQYSWYQPFTWEPPLNATESYNVSVIQREERRR